MIGSLIKANADSKVQDQLWADVDQAKFGNDRKEFERVLRASSNRVARFVFRGLTKPGPNGDSKALDSGPGRSDAVSGILNSLGGDMLRTSKRQKSLTGVWSKTQLLLNTELANEDPKTSEDYYDPNKLILPPKKLLREPSFSYLKSLIGVVTNKVQYYVDEDPNVASPTAPVNIPHVWGAPDLECLQTNCLGQSPMVRNVGESFGVFGYVELNDSAQRFKSTAKFDNQQKIETSLKSLGRPAWPISSRKVSSYDSAYADIEKGKEIYKKHCMSCHGLKGESGYYAEDNGSLGYNNTKFVRAPQIDFVTGELARTTDKNRPDMLFMLAHGGKQQHTGLISPNVVKQVENDIRSNRQHSGLSQKLFDCWTGDDLSFYADSPLANIQTCHSSRSGQQGKMSGIDFLGLVTIAASERWFDENNIPENVRISKYNFNHKYSPNFTRPVLKTRPLDGLLFSGPYMHNGSIRTLAQLLEIEPRQKSFRIGTTDLDEKQGGFRDAGSYVFDTAPLGNRNIGHEYHESIREDSLSEAEYLQKRLHLLEYLKTL